MADLYAVLGIDRNTTPEEIKRAYRAKAKVHHPDHGGSVENFVAITTAYEVLSDPKHRATYDRDATITRTSPLNEVTTKALAIIEQMLGQALGELPPDGKVYDDVIEKMRGAVGESRTHLVQAIEQAKQQAEKLRHFGAKFQSGKKNYLAEMVEYRAAQQERRATEMSKALAWHDKAVEILADFSFQADVAPQVTVFSSLGPGAMPFGR